jgi:hypothetical protein
VDRKLRLVALLLLVEGIVPGCCASPAFAVFLVSGRRTPSSIATVLDLASPRRRLH